MYTYGSIVVKNGVYNINLFYLLTVEKILFIISKGIIISIIINVKQLIPIFE